MQGYGQRVLIVDDNEDVLEVLALTLGQAGYTVFLAHDGMGALCEIDKRHYDVIVTDCLMPHLTGLGVLAYSREVMPNTPVIIVSGADPSMEHAAMERGAYAWIGKPFDPARLLDVVHAAAQHGCARSNRPAGVHEVRSVL